MGTEEVTVSPGRYVIAVSGGVDSTVLLNLLCNQQGVELIVAHVDHGTRNDSHLDQEFVEELAASKSLQFATTELKLGPDASEETARKARYGFLEKVLQATKSKAIITAHNQDDVIETAIINLMRGTKHKGIGSLKNRDKIIRPLLDISKSQILTYADQNHIKWREDPTNLDTKYLRNYVRHKLLPKLSTTKRAQLLESIKASQKDSSEIESLLEKLKAIHVSGTKEKKEFSRQFYTMLPANVRKEFLNNLLNDQNIEVSQKKVDYLDMKIRTAREGSKFAIDAKNELQIKNAKVLVIAKSF